MCHLIKLPAIVYYDVLVMFTSELQYIWKKPFTFPTILLIINRYMMLLRCSFALIYFVSWESATEETADSVSEPLSTSISAFSKEERCQVLLS